MRLPLLSLYYLALSSLANGSLYNESSKRYALAKARQGHIVGYVETKVAIFWGIPYSQAPTGEWRWRNPRDPLPFTEKYWNATYKRPACMQYCKRACPPKISEDCLYLNVFVPRQLLKPSNQSQVLNESHYSMGDDFTKGGATSSAVMAFLHGGNFIQGSGSNLLYDGRFLAQRGNVVVVTLNYRLGSFGFLVQGTGQDAAKGNYGIRDQIKALEWIKNNIMYFGGNPKNITLFGESAGAESIGILMTSLLGKGLFHQAIYESDPLSLPFRNIADAQIIGSKFARELGCTAGNMSCLRNIDGKKIIADTSKSTNFFSLTENKILLKFQQWGPTIDGIVIVEHPMEAFRKGKFYHLPVIMGYNLNEAYSFVELAIHGLLPSTLYRVLLALFAKNNTEAVLNQYPPCTTPNCDNKKTLRELTNDYIFICPTRKAEYFLKPHSWMYTFNASLPFKQLWKTSSCTKKACHGSELAYVFDTALLTKAFHFKSGETNLSHKIQYYWTNVAKFGNPNGNPKANVTNWANAEHWDRFYNYRNKSYRSLDLTSDGNHILFDPDKAKCDFWDKLDIYGKL